MSIHNFLFFALCCIWLYLLMWLACKLCKDRILGVLRSRRMKIIDAAFAPDCPAKKRRRTAGKLPRFARDELLFTRICDRYAALPAACPANVRFCFCQAMTEVFHARIASLDESDLTGRILLGNCIRRCRISSRKTQAFLAQNEADPLVSRLSAPIPDSVPEKAVG